MRRLLTLAALLPSLILVACGNSGGGGYISQVGGHETAVSIHVFSLDWDRA